MKGKENQCDEAFQTFQKEYPVFFKQSIVQSFLQKTEHLELVKQAICFPTKLNKQAADEAFQRFYESVKALTYLSNLIYYNAINFDKTIQKHHNREMLLLDQPLQGKDEEGATHKDMLYQPASDIVDVIVGETISDYVEEKRLYQAIQTLTPKQQQILTYKYVHGFKNKKIAEVFEDTPQNVSKLHRRTLKKLKDYLQKERNYYDDS